MQDQINEKTVTLMVRGTKFTAKLFGKALKALLDDMDMRIVGCDFHQEDAFLGTLPLCKVPPTLYELGHRNMLTTGAASMYPFASYELMDDNGILVGTNVTNGIAHRRWLTQANPKLAALIAELIGTGYNKNAAELAKLRAFEDDKSVLQRLGKIKEENKARFAPVDHRARNAHIHRRLF